MTWVGGFYDPESFDSNRTNHALRALAASAGKPQPKLESFDVSARWLSKPSIFEPGFSRENGGSPLRSPIDARLGGESLLWPERPSNRAALANDPALLGLNLLAARRQLHRPSVEVLLSPGSSPRGRSPAWVTRVLAVDE